MTCVTPPARRDQSASGSPCNRPSVYRRAVAICSSMRRSSDMGLLLVEAETSLRYTIHTRLRREHRMIGITGDGSTSLGPTRREWLRLGALAPLGLALPRLLA